MVFLWICVPSLTFFNPMDCSPPGSSVHGISQARILENTPFPTPGDLPDLETKPALAGGFFTTALPGKPSYGYRSQYFFLI